VGMIIQSILVPREISIEALIAEKGLEWLEDANLDERADFERYARFTQMPVEKFDKDSLTLTKVSDKGVWILGGEVLDEKDEADALTVQLGDDVARKLSAIPTSPMEMPIAEVAAPSFKVTFRDMFERELSNFVSVVTGLMGQSGASKETRKSAIMDALDAFSSFLDMSLDSLGEKVVKFDEGFQKTNKEEEVEEMFETKEEFTEAVTEIIVAVLDERDKAAKEAAEAAAKAKEGTGDDKKSTGTVVTTQALSAMEAEIAEIKKTVKDFTEKTDKTLAQLNSDPGALEAGNKDGKEKEAVEDDPNAKKSIFRGVFIRNKAAK
jgi:hypothetical protein